MNVDNLELAKNILAEVDFNRCSYEFIKACSLTAIAYTLIAIAEKVVGK